MTKENTIHMAIIPDGNRRWATSEGLPTWKGHERAIENFRDVTDWCRQHHRINVLTVWCFSAENWRRSQEEVRVLMRLFESYLRSERGKFREEHMRLLHSGRTDRIPPALATLLREVQEDTVHGEDFTLHLALDYSGKDEIVRAAQRLVDAAEELSEESVRRYLDHPELPDIDLIIRTSGETRTSNFFLWQSAYAEWLFLEKHFPELTVEDLEAAIAAFDRRTRRFGG